MLQIDHPKVGWSGGSLKCRVRSTHFFPDPEPDLEGRSTQVQEEEESDDDLELEEDSWSDDGLVEALETLDLTDGFRDYAYHECNDDY